MKILLTGGPLNGEEREVGIASLEMSFPVLQQSEAKYRRAFTSVRVKSGEIIGATYEYVEPERSAFKQLQQDYRDAIDKLKKVRKYAERFGRTEWQGQHFDANEIASDLLSILGEPVDADAK